MYRHTQVGYPMLALDLVLVVLLGVPGFVRGSGALLMGAAIPLVVAVLFSTLTIEVRDDVLRFHFGPGLFGKRIPLRAIAAAAPSRSRWWEGIAIRVTPYGMLYTVASGPAVEIALASGEHFRLGTDQQGALLAALGSGGA
ncbi:MAG TPA: hypothetical protein VIP79_05135 [Gemmatimonadaceae bacterium]